ASNIGSAATLVGNPQNILVGEALKLSFSKYLFDSFVPVLLSLVSLWLILSWQYKKHWLMPVKKIVVDEQPFSLGQSIKGGIITLCLLAVFIFGFFSRDVAALSAAGFLLISRSMRSRDILKNVNWQLLVLFISLFIVNFALNESGMLQEFQNFVLNGGIDLYKPGWLFVVSAGLSNIVSNVPTVMLLLPLAKHPLAGSVLALSSTLAGNFFIVGSIANIIVVQQSDRLGVHLSWVEHAKTGMPVALVSLTIAGLWLWLSS
ncbi:MAG TPA: anion transporter, partial [candidate division Zixibacteria bacterium]|nr:anion transporter [candidate division Zixibacteria bacterium]